MKRPAAASIIVEAVGRRIAEVRRERGYTQREVAALAAKPVKWWSRVELGQENLTLITLAELADALEVAPAALLEPPTGDRVAKRGRPRKTLKPA